MYVTVRTSLLTGERMDLKASRNERGGLDVKGTPSVAGGVFIATWENGTREITNEVDLLGVSEEDGQRIETGDPDVYDELVYGPDASGKIAFAVGKVGVRGFGFTEIVEYAPYTGTPTDAADLYDTGM